jgi:hypothetical protein
MAAVAPLPGPHLQLRDALEWERWLCQRSCGHSEKQQGVVVTGGAVEVQLLAAGATVNQDPFTVTTDTDGDRLHRGAALGRPIPGVPVEMAAPQAVGTVVAVRRPWRVEWYVETAAPAAERTDPSTTRPRALVVCQV